METAVIYIAIVFFIIVIAITAYWGSKRLLWVAATCSVFLGVMFGLTQSLDWKGIESGLICAIPLLFLTVSTGVSVRAARERGKRILKKIG